MYRSSRRRLALFVWVCSALLAAHGVVHTQATLPDYPLKLSPNGSSIVDQNNRPFFINGEAAWSLIAQLSKADAETYLQNRRLKGYNLVLAELIEHEFSAHPPANFYGEQPFLTQGDFNTPNEAYFAHADWIISDAASKGLVVLLAPLYLGYACGSQGWCGEVKNSSLATMHSWGRYVGNRYKNYRNIIWVIGGDVDPVTAGVSDKVQEFVAGLTETDNTHLVTAHNATRESAVAPWPNADWLNVNDVYAAPLTYVASTTEFNRVPFKPFFLIESYYENEHGSTPLSLRSQAYWTVLSGGILGHIFGNCPIWSFGSAPSFCTSVGSASWQTQLDSVGSVTLALVGKLFNSRPFYKLIPDLNHQVLTAGNQSGANYATAAKASDGSTVIAFIPTARTVMIDMAKISGRSARAWWYNTRTGAATLIGDFSTTGRQSFTVPDSNDWVLVADDESLNLPAPGAPLNAAPPPTPANLRLLR